MAPSASDFPAGDLPTLALLLERGPVAACLKDAENQFRYVYLTPEWARTLGRDVGECLGKNDFELSPAPIAGQLRQIDQQALSGSRYAGIIVNTGETGERMLYAVALPVETQAGRRYLACCSVEIGMQALADREAAALQHYERGAGLAAERLLAKFESKHARLRRLVESGIVGIFVGAGDTIVEANRAFLDLLGFTADDVAEGRLKFSDISPPEYAETDRLTHREMAERGVSTPKEKEYIARDGRRVPIYGAGALLDAESMTWIGFVIDRSEQKRLEERLLRSQLWESLGYLASGLAHDFNNLLVVILGNTALSLNDPNLSPETAARLRDVMSAGQKGSQLVEQLLNYAGRGRFVHAPVDLAAVVRASAAALRVPPNIAVRLNLGHGLPEVEGDRRLLRTLVDNLLSNAVEAVGGEGEVVVTLGLEEVARERRLIAGQDLAPGRYVRLSVEDTGPGIPPDLHARIFEPFFTTRFLGRGLGLPAALGIARRHGGAITVGKCPTAGGTIFEVFLPAKS